MGFVKTIKCFKIIKWIYFPTAISFIALSIWSIGENLIQKLVILVERKITNTNYLSGILQNSVKKWKLNDILAIFVKLFYKNYTYLVQNGGMLKFEKISSVPPFWKQITTCHTSLEREFEELSSYEKKLVPI